MHNPVFKLNSKSLALATLCVLAGVAAPTAALHFDEALFAQFDAMGVQRAHVTLHVGAGTFQPVKTDFRDVFSESLAKMFHFDVAKQTEMFPGYGGLKASQLNFLNEVPKA